jgi:hypothetical protein
MVRRRGGSMVRRRGGSMLGGEVAQLEERWLTGREVAQ